MKDRCMIATGDWSIQESERNRGTVMGNFGWDREIRLSHHVLRVLLK